LQDIVKNEPERMKIKISIASQILELLDNTGKSIRQYAISTARNGAGELNGSFCTPRGRHIVRAKIGASQPVNAVFVERRPTGEIYTPELAQQYPGRDWILSRILWLSGKEVGFNRLGCVDTMRRHIYIHGSPDGTEMGKPGSRGCIRMSNHDMLELYDLIPAGTVVEIAET
jgi:lipoprotein-anchoring transpeptidase ErfK/SrfK